MLDIKKIGNPILRKKSIEIELTDEVRDFINEMKETMYQADGIGLAAPQVGRNERIVVIDVGAGFIALINPKITKRKGTASFSEGCLSVPNFMAKVKRSKEISVEALDENGKKINIDADGMLACCIQHEIDHLNGILFVDKISLLDKIKRKFKK